MGNFSTTESRSPVESFLCGIKRVFHPFVGEIMEQLFVSDHRLFFADPELFEIDLPALNCGQELDGRKARVESFMQRFEIFAAQSSR